MSGFDDVERLEADYTARMKRLTQHAAALVRIARGESTAVAAIVFTHRCRERRHLDRKHSGRRRPRYERTRPRL